MNTTTESTCSECNGSISAEMAAEVGICFQCQCELHAIGAYDMDYTDGIADYPRGNEGDEPRDWMTPEEQAVSDGDACWLSDSPFEHHRRERVRLTTGVSVFLTVKGEDPWGIPF